MTGMKRIAAFAAVALAMALFAAKADPLKTEATLSYRMLQVESTVRPVSKAKFALLYSVLDRAANAAGDKYTRPRTRRQAIEVLDAIQVTLARHNFIQPTSRDEWKDTIGDAFEPLRLTREERLRLLAPGEVNGFRARYIDPSKPLYSVGAEIGSQLIISAGQRMGWDIRLVAAPEHYFVRWYYAPGEYINWDWTAGGPSRDEYYSRDGGELYRDWPARRRYLQTLTPGYIRANYYFLLSRHVDATPGKRRVLELAMAADPTHEQVQNSLAWLYATDPGLRRTHARRAVAYALSAWAASPDDASVADTVACAYAARGERALATQIEKHAIARLRAEGGPRRDYERRLRQIEEGGTCTLAARSNDDAP
jgi:hypothetical protein